MTVVYEDNHIIIVSKTTGEIVQGDKTGDKPLSNTSRKRTPNRATSSLVLFIVLTVPCSDSSCLHVLRRHWLDSMPCLQTAK